MQQTALTKSQGIAVLKGRNPFDIVPYTVAVTALKECLTFDDTKYWSSFAEAAMAWARINGAKEALRLARALRLRAAKRLAELAIALRGLRNRKGSLEQPAAKDMLMREASLSSMEASGALLLAKHPVSAETLMQKARPPALGTIGVKLSLNRWRNHVSQGWHSFLSMTRRVSPKEAAKYANEARAGVDVVREQATAIRDWLDTFIAALPKKAR